MKILIGKEIFDVIKMKSYLRKNQWYNHIPCSLRIKMNIEDYLNLKWIVEKFENDFNFKSVEDDGIYSCSSIMNNSTIISRFPNNDVLCKLDLTIFEKNKLSKSESRDIVLNMLSI